MTIRSIFVSDAYVTVEREIKVRIFSPVMIFGKTYEDGDIFTNVIKERVMCPRKRNLLIAEYNKQTGHL